MPGRPDELPEPSSRGLGHAEPPERVIIQLDSGASAPGVQRAIEAIAGRVNGGITPLRGGDDGSGLLRLELTPGAHAEGLLNALSRLPGVRFVEVDQVVTLLDDVGETEEPPSLEPGGVEGFEASNDPGFTSNKSWGMYGDVTSPAN